MVFLATVEFALFILICLVILTEVVYPSLTGGKWFPNLRGRFKSKENRLKELRDEIYSDELEEIIKQREAELREKQPYTHQEKESE